MRRGEYHHYLLSSEWQSIRLKRIKFDGYMCTECGSREGLNVHHRTYERVGCEDIVDLVTLCRSCHKRRHRR